MLLCLALALSVMTVLCKHLDLPEPLQPGEDPFGEQRKEKKARLASQEGRQLKNKQASDKVHGKPALPPTLKLAASLPEHGKGAPTKKRELKLDVSTILAHESPCLPFSFPRKIM